MHKCQKVNGSTEESYFHKFLFLSDLQGHQKIISEGGQPMPHPKPLRHKELRRDRSRHCQAFSTHNCIFFLVTFFALGVDK